MTQTMTPVETIAAFIAAWNRMDMDTAYGMMASDIIWHNIPMEPAVGIDACKALMGSLPPIEGVNWVTHHISASGKVVMTERTDNFTLAGGKNAAIRLMGIFELNDDGKIAKWRDYFDSAEMAREFGGDAES